MHADRTNRAVLVVFGVLLLAVGIAGLGASVGWFGTSFSHHVLFDNRVSRYVGNHGTWLWPLLAVACVVAILIVLRWLVALLLSTDRAGDVLLPGDRSAGRTMLRPGALASAVRAEIESYRGVEAVKARVLGDPSRPELVITASVAASADLDAVRRRIEAEALTHARQAMASPELPIQLDLDVSRGDLASTRPPA